MAPRVDPVASDTEVPPRTGVVVIGGGIIGTCTAFFLARKGVPVVLCEKGHIAGEQSSRNWGWCRKMGRDPREIPLAIEALRLWPETERAHRGGDRLPPLRHRLSVQDAGGDGEARGVAGGGAAVSARHAQAVARRGGRGAAGPDGRLAGRALHAERRPRRAAEGGAGDRRGGAAAWRRGAAAMRGARHRDAGRARGGRGDREAGASPATAWCSPAACGRGCSAATSICACRSSR